MKVTSDVFEKHEKQERGQYGAWMPVRSEVVRSVAVEIDPGLRLLRAEWGTYREFFPDSVRVKEIDQSQPRLWHKVEVIANGPCITPNGNRHKTHREYRQWSWDSGPEDSPPRRTYQEWLEELPAVVREAYDLARSRPDLEETDD